jgi:hypothetical protein
MVVDDDDTALGNNTVPEGGTDVAGGVAGGENGDADAAAAVAAAVGLSAMNDCC